MASIAELLITGANEQVKDAPDIQGALKTGSELALRKEQLLNQRAELEAKRGEIQQAKLTKFVEAVQKGQNFKDPSAKKNYYGKFLPAYRSQLGLDDQFTDETLSFVTGSPENLARFNKLVADVQDGSMPAQEALAIVSDPMKFADVTPEMQDDILGAQKTFLGNKAQTARLNQQASQFDTRTGMEQNQQFNTQVSQINDDVASRLKPLQEKKLAVRTAYDSLQSVAKDIGAGKKPSSIEFAVGARSLAKAFNSGAMTDQDVADFKKENGITEWTEDWVRKWLVGGANQNALAALIKTAQRSASNLDKETQTIAGGLLPRMRISGFEDRENEVRKKSGIDSYLTPTIAPKKKAADGGEELQVRGKPMAHWKRVINAATDAAQKSKAIKQLAAEAGKTEDEIRKLLEK